MYKKLDAVPGLLRSLFTTGREKLEAARSGRGGNQTRKHHGAGGAQTTDTAMQETDAVWRSGGDVP